MLHVEPGLGALKHVSRFRLNASALQWRPNYHMYLRAWVIAFPLFAAFALGAETIDFKKQVQPILEQRCIECHGEKKQKSGIRFDRKSSVFKPGDSGKPAVIPGKSSDSLLLQRVITSNDDEVMPPKGDRLTEQQVGTLRAWIDQGANWPGGEDEKVHWAYVKPIRPAVPGVSKSVINESVISRKANLSPRARESKTASLVTPRHPIDAFVLARLQKEKLKPSPSAERATLLRRVSLDLIGLPPTIEEVELFENDKSPRALEAVVDRLLASPHFGERWARPWLDGARFADTQGYEKDAKRSQWPWRDWVIKALNADMPFDEFTIEQLAGDLLPDATQEQKVATGFHRNTMTNTEGGTDDEEFRYEALIDRVNTTWQVWMGSTMACAQCHNHKYDPFSAKEYYQFMAFLNNTADADKDDERPTIKVFGTGQEQHLAELKDKTKVAQREFSDAAAKPEIASAQTEWERRTVEALTNWITLDPTNFVSSGGATLTKTASMSIEASGTNSSNDTYTVVARVGAGKVTGLRLEVLESGAKKVLGRHENGSFVLRQVEASLDDRSLTFADATADYSQKNYSVTNLLSGKGNGWAVDASDNSRRVRRSAYLKLSEPLELKEPAALTVKLTHTDKNVGANLARFRLYVTSVEQVGPPSSLSNDLREVLLLAANKRGNKQVAKLKEHFESIAPELKPVRDALVSAKKVEKGFYDSIPSSAVMQAVEKPRETYLHLRGAYLTKSEVVNPATPAVLHPFRTNEPATRLTLARWIVSTNNPLTARVTVNRVWEQIFGRGIVETVEEFGKQGEPPSHPELLDWLACEFMEPTLRNDEARMTRDQGNSALDVRHSSLRQPWSFKSLVKTIVMSSTYQQSSRVSPELAARDPDNRLMARGPRVRLEGEMIRDQALTVSGLLSHKLGGPSVMPPQPEGLWQVVYNGEKWETSKGEDKYRRGLYTFWRRTTPHPMMVSFDAPSREYCVLKRNRSNTPLQSLNLLNDPAFVECAQALARKVTAKKDCDSRQRMEFLFRTCLSRTPTVAELDRLTNLFEQQLANYRSDAKAAEKLAMSELGKSTDETDVAELAAWTVVANVLLNLDEMITKG
ncbi:MAG TPA: PSD1 and planctomycete cytochrome C domain-containing protein [Candidatus Acidoferrum sp.]|nr:PSD1 and planctomycete cytochrome C domain-containing protein [Candidatus Acidoferrum sp.]